MDSQDGLVLETEHPLDGLDVRLGDQLVRGQATGDAGGLVLQVVAAVSLLALELAATGELEALLGATMGLELRHIRRSPYLLPGSFRAGDLAHSRV